MTKQEEIGGITKIDRILIEYARAVGDVEDEEHDPPMTHSMMRAEWGRLLDKVKRDLSEQGVVIKVNRELPSYDNHVLGIVNEQGRTAQRQMIKAGYVAVEPLIGE